MHVVSYRCKSRTALNTKPGVTRHMARRSSQNGTATAEGTAQADKATVAFSLPTEFYNQLKTLAGEMSPAAFVRKTFADLQGWTLPAAKRGRAGSYAGLSAEEKAAKQKAAYDEKQAKVKALLELYESGALGITLTPEQLEANKPKHREPKATAEAPATAEATA